MTKYDIVVSSEFVTDTKTEEDFITLFNQKLATLFLIIEQQENLGLK